MYRFIIFLFLVGCSGEFADDRCGDSLPMVVTQVEWCGGFGSCRVTYEDGTQGTEPNPIPGTASKKKCRAQ